MSILAALRRSAFGSALLVLSLFAFAACDSDDDDGLSAEDFDGEYTFTTLEFQPGNPNLPTANLLTRITANSARLDLQGSRGTFELTYQLPGNTSRIFLTGSFSVDGDQVRLNFDDQSNPENLFLPETLRLNISDDESTLSAEIARSGVNLEAFEEMLGVPEGEREYVDITEASGTLVIALSES